MALKRNFATGTKYYYVKLRRSIYEKSGIITLDMYFSEKDTANPDYNKTLNNQTFLVQPALPGQNDPFSIENMNEQGMNLVKIGYTWLKTNIDLFRDFEDC